MWQWLKSNIFKPVGNFFTGIFTRVRDFFARNFFTGEDSRRAEYQSVPSEPLEKSSTEETHDENLNLVSQLTANDQTVAAKPSDLNNVTSKYEPLPDEVQVEIFSYLNENQKAQSALARTSHQFYSLFKSQCWVNKLLSLAADATQPAVDKLLTMLDKNPSLLRVRGNVITRGGDDVRRVTLYEFCLGAGDPELAAEIALRFDKIPDGEAEREQQYNRYKPHIDAMKRQAPYDLNALIESIISSSDEDVTACLNKNFNHESELNTALKQFREDHAPRVIRKPCMHYNHKTLEQAFNLLCDQWAALSSNDTNYDKCRLVYRQIIGYLQRTLPGIDRIGFARAFQDNKRLLNFIWDRDNRFPDTCGDGGSVLSGLGFDELIFGWAPPLPGDRWAAGRCADVSKFMSNKNFELTELMQPRRTQTTGCVIC